MGRKDPGALPRPLVLLAADTGNGWVPLGPTAAKLGRRVANVLEDPSITASGVEIHRTRTRQLHITGTGFIEMRRTRVTLNFEPALDSANVHVDVRIP